MSGAEGAGRALAMDEQARPLSIHHMLLGLAGVVRNIVQERQLGLRMNVAESLPYEMGNDLAVGERAVNSGSHGAKIGFSDGRTNGCASQFPVRQFDSIPGCACGHACEKLGADLVAQ